METPKIDVPLGYCACGCGKKTRIATRSRTLDGTVKGKPLKFIRFHTGAIPRNKSRRFFQIDGESVVGIPLSDGTELIVDVGDDLNIPSNVT